MNTGCALHKLWLFRPLMSVGDQFRSGEAWRTGHGANGRAFLCGLLHLTHVFVNVTIMAVQEPAYSVYCRNSAHVFGRMEPMIPDVVPLFMFCIEYH